MTKQRLGRVIVRTSSSDFPMRVGEVLRIKEPGQQFNRAFKEYRIVSGEDQEFIAVVVLCKPTTNKFQVGGPVIRG